MDFHTGLYTPAAAEVMRASYNLFTGYWKTTQIKHSSRPFLDRTTIAPDGEVVVEGGSAALWHKNAKDISKWFAIHLKLAVKRNSESRWSRTNTEIVHDLGEKVTVSDVYLIYDYLLGRRNLHTKYSKGQIDRFIGEQRDPVTTELEVARREEVKRLQNDLLDRLAAIETETRDDIAEYRRKREAEALVKKEAIRKEIADKIEELNKQVVAA